jgi:acyl carrier protein
MPDIDTTDTRALVEQALAEVLDKDLPGLTDDTRLFGDLGLDSTSVIDLLMSLEDSLGLRIDPDQLTAEAFETFGTLTGYVATCLAVAQEPVG